MSSADRFQKRKAADCKYCTFFFLIVDTDIDNREGHGGWRESEFWPRLADATSIAVVTGHNATRKRDTTRPSFLAAWFKRRRFCLVRESPSMVSSRPPSSKRIHRRSSPTPDPTQAKRRRQTNTTSSSSVINLTLDNSSSDLEDDSDAVNTVITTRATSIDDKRHGSSITVEYDICFA